MGIVLFFAQGAAAMFGVWVEDKGGTRFINELANRRVRADAIMTLLNKGTKCYAVADSLGHRADGSLAPRASRKDARARVREEVRDARGAR